MNVDAMLKDLAAERVADFVPLLRRAYELGYREGMAATGQPSPAPAPPAAPVSTSAAAASQTPETVIVNDGGAVLPAASTSPLDSADPREDDDEDDEPESDAAEKPSYPVLRSSSTIGGLLRKIERVFRLEERFELVVRIENPSTGRALPRNVRLSSYLRND